MSDFVGLDIECFDPHLSEKGASWVYGEGHILCTSVYDGKTSVVKGCKGIEKYLLDTELTIIGANIQYDLGWLEYELGIRTKAKILDIFFAENLIDEHSEVSLERLAQKYLGRGKKISRLEDWAKEKGLKGDVRKHLKEAPWELLEEYAREDAELPVLIYKEQEKILLEQNLMEPFLLDCDLIPMVIEMKRKGILIDTKKKKENAKYLRSLLDKETTSFQRRYGKVNLGSTKQLAELFDKEDVPYRIKITVKSKGGVKYTWANMRQGLDDLASLVSGFKPSKGQIVMLTNTKYVPKIALLLENEGFVFTANPTIDAPYLASITEDYPLAYDIVRIKKLKGVLDKFLGAEFDRYITKEGRVHPDYNISRSERYGTLSGRFSCSNPNLQQIVSKGELEDGEDTILLAKLCREVFVPEQGCHLMSIDYSQIEYRLLVHYAVGQGSNAVREEFNTNPDTDYHAFVVKLTGLDRKHAKNLSFGIMYGMGVKGMAEAFNWPLSKAQEYYDQYLLYMPFVKSTREKVEAVGKERGYILTIGGRRARPKTKDHLYALLNRLNQGGSADIMKKSMLQIWEEGLHKTVPVHITVHDELVCSVPKTKEGKITALRIKEIMETAVELRIPIKADLELGPNWYDLKEGWNEE